MAAIACAILAGCSTSHYRKAADKEVYGIINEVEQAVFGRTNEFTINTEYSGTDPESVTSEDIREQRKQSETVFLTLEDALNLAVRQSREFQSQKERLYLTALNLTGERYEFGPRFFAGASTTADWNKDRGWVGSVNSQARVAQALKSGGSLGVTIANDLLRFYTGDPRKSAVSSITVNLFQPLLRGAFASIAAESLKQAERNVVYAIREFAHFQNEFEVSIVAEFFRILELKDSIRNRYSDYQSRVNSLNRLEAQLQAGNETSVGVGQARQAELSAKNAYINTIANYENTLDRFKISLGLPITVDLQLDDSALEQLVERGLIPVVWDSEEAYRIAVENHLELMNDIDRFEDSKRQIHVTANRLKPDLNIFANASVESERPTDYTDFDINDVRPNVGVELDLPFDRLRERNSYRATLVNFELAIRNLSLALDNKRNQVDSGLRNIRQFRQNYDIQRLALKLARERVLGADLNYQAGRAVVRDLLEAQDEEVAAKNAVTAALVDYLQARLQLLLDMGVLNTDVDQFWLRHDALLLNGETADGLSAPEEAPIQDEVIPPDKLFEERS